jgi:hypothetical protein
MQFRFSTKKVLLIGSLTLFTIAVSTTLWSNTQSETVLKPFTTDGCSSFPDGTLSQRELWLGCCQRHDKAYWKGGTKSERKTADIELKQCVTKVGKPEIAKLMLAGVRVGGSPYWPTSFRWGYGWNYPRKYGALSENEQLQVSKKWLEFRKKVDVTKAEKD